MDKEILYKYIIGDASPEEKEAVVRWIDADKENMKEYLALHKLYTITIWQQEPAPAALERVSKGRKQWALSSVGRELLKIAAIFVIAFSVVSIYYSRTEPETVPQEAIMQTIYVPAGQRAELTLSDSTKVWLNARTTLTFPSHFDGNNRSVTLDGEGYFDVTHNESKPFIVKTEQYDIKVLGTEFNVNAYKGNVLFETSLLKGSVRIESANHKEGILLEPNKKAFTKHGQLKTSPIVQYDYFLWKEGLICFDDNTIGDLFEKLRLYFDVNIIIENTKILNQRYTGKFRTSDGVEHVLKTLQLRTKFKYEKKDDKESTIIIK